MREYGADLVSRTVADFSGVRVERVERRLEAGRPAALHVALAGHAVYAEMSRGFVCERDIAGAGRTRFVTEPGLLSFRAAGSEIRGTTRGDGIVAYGAVFIDPHHAALEACLASLPAAPRPVTAVRSERLWAELAPLIAECADGAAHSRPMHSHPFRSLYAQGRAVALLAALADEAEFTPRDARQDRRVQAAIAWIDDNLTREFSLPDLAAAANVSASQLVRLFRQSLGVTPMAYLSTRRLGEARRLLRQSNWSIERIAAHLGYTDPSHFTRRFRSNVGMTPAAWRRRRDGA